MFAGSVMFCQAQKMTDPVFFANTINSENLKKNLYKIAGPDFEGRETATAGQHKAASYLSEYFKGLGLQPGNHGDYQLTYPVYIDSSLSASIRINNDTFRLYRDFDLRISSAHDISFGLNDVVFAGYGISDSLRDDYKGLQTAGKVVLVLNGYPPGYINTQIEKNRFNSFGKQDAAMQHGAVALLIIQDGFVSKTLPEKSDMYLNYDQSVIRPNSLFISEKMARLIMGPDYEMAKTGYFPSKTYAVSIRISIQKDTKFLYGSDVLAYLEGSDLKDQLLVISAHYDHLGKQGPAIYYGADDDGSGTVSLLELATAFSKAKNAGQGPRRSILFLANSGEEKGLWGSEFYTSHPVYPLNKTTADLNMDMVGRKDPGRTYGDADNYVYVVGDDKISSDLKSISVGMNKKFTKLELDYKFNNPKDPLKIFYRSDHYNFARHGVPIIFYFDGINEDYHHTSDTPDKIDYDLLVKRVKLVFYTAWEMPNRNDMLKRNLPLREKE